jgi:hypothetical protein
MRRHVTIYVAMYATCGCEQLHAVLHAYRVGQIRLRHAVLKYPGDLG